jgi:hypothetical protein
MSDTVKVYVRPEVSAQREYGEGTNREICSVCYYPAIVSAKCRQTVALCQRCLNAINQMVRVITPERRGSRMKPELKGLVDGLSEPEREELLTYLEGLETSSGSFQCSFPPVPDMETRHNGDLTRRGHLPAATRAAGCQCGPHRRDVTAHQDDSVFWPRHGCANCNLWDGPPRTR